MGQELLRAAHLVDDAQLMEPLVVLLDPQLADDLEHVSVMRSSVERPSTGIALASAAVRSMSSREGATLRRGILQPVGVARIAIERGGRRVELEDALPESVGQVVDGGERSGWLVGHADASSYWALTGRSGRSAAR